MDYILTRTELENDGHRSIHILDIRKAQHLIYYPEEISHLEQSLRTFLFTRLKGINEGQYDA
ncbi:hypothetical protein [Halobacillus halophilus]|uniref:hypothetical protein n=1 Tax=Halobacillus halophilus TaxID=1570 RepID=UPI001CD4EAB6|nr:hypothetical protein [Halobacillus halophilus]MCA1010699.1 hypothetical protein [Halobacillus halophilus]